MSLKVKEKEFKMYNDPELDREIFEIWKENDAVKDKIEKDGRKIYQEMEHYYFTYKGNWLESIYKEERIVRMYPKEGYQYMLIMQKLYDGVTDGELRGIGKNPLVRDFIVKFMEWIYEKERLRSNVRR